AVPTPRLGFAPRSAGPGRAAAPRLRTLRPVLAPSLDHRRRCETTSLASCSANRRSRWSRAMEMEQQLTARAQLAELRPFPLQPGLRGSLAQQGFPASLTS